MESMKYWLAFGIGVAAGAAVALAYAPQTGEKTRRQVKRNFEDATEYVQDTVEEFGKRMERPIRMGREAVESVKATAEWAANQVSQAI